MGKRGNGEGSIGRRKDGLYMARYTVQTATGSKRKTLYGKTRQEVAAKLGRFWMPHGLPETVLRLSTCWLSPLASGAVSS
jgi:hypothetical protein